MAASLPSVAQRPLFRPAAASAAGAGAGPSAAAAAATATAAGGGGSAAPSARLSGHLMYDERVRRGPALSRTTPRATQFEVGMAESLASQAETRARAAAGGQGSLRSHASAASFAAQLGLPAAARLVRLDASAALDVTARKRGPNAFDLRAGSAPREEVDVSSFLCEAAAPRATAEAGTQGDAIVGGDSAPGALTGPTRAHHKTGVDASAQVQHGSTRWQARPRFAGAAESSSAVASASGAAPLFDFDAASDELVAGLSGRVLEQAALEVEHEAELIALARRREVVQAALDADAANARRLEEEAQQRFARRAAQKEQAAAEYARAEAALAKVSAQALARSMIEGRGGAVPVAVAQLHGEGFFVDPAEAMVRADVLPDLYASLAAATSQRADAAGVVDGLISDAAAAAAARLAAQHAAEAKEKAELTKNCAFPRRLRRHHRSQRLCTPHVSVCGRPPLTCGFPLPLSPTCSLFFAPADFIKVYVRVPRRPEDVEKNGTLPPGTRAIVDGRHDLEPVEVVDTSDGEGDFRTVVVGPVPVARVDLVSAIEARVHEWVQQHNNRHTRRIVAMAGGPAAPLALWANHARLPPGEPMLARKGNPLAGLEGLELRPRGIEWDVTVPEEDEGQVA
jgi:hypothetical protein